MPSSSERAPGAPKGALRRHADAVFDRTSPYPGDAFSNHCRRLHRFTTMLMAARGIAFDDEVAYAIAMWHDLGIVSERDEGHNYLQRSRSLFLREINGFDLGGIDLAVAESCLLYNHRVLPVPGLDPAANCFRHAVMMEHTRGTLRFGLERAPVHAVFEERPRGDFDRVLLDFTWRTLRREPLTIVHGIFF